MKLKCVYSEDQGKYPTFIVGKEYEVYDKKGDVYYVVTENETYIDIPLNGNIWKFELIEDEKEERKEKKTYFLKLKV